MAEKQTSDRFFPVGADNGKVAPMPVRIIENTDGHLAAVSVSDIATLTLDCIDWCEQAAERIPAHISEMFAVYQSWSWEYDPSGRAEDGDREYMADDFNDQGDPLLPDSNILRAHYNNHLAPDLQGMAGLDIGQLFSLKHFAEDTKEGAVSEWQFISLRDTYGYHDMAIARTDGALAARYMDGLQAYMAEQHAAWSDANWSVRQLRYGAMKEYSDLMADARWLSKAADKLLEDVPRHEWSKPVFVDVNKILVDADKIRPDGSIAPAAAMDVASHLVHAVLGKQAGTYDVGSLVLEHAPKGDGDYLSILIRDLVQFSDTGDMVNRAFRHGVEWDLRKIPDELVDAYNDGLIRGAAAEYHRDKNKVRVFQPPAGGKIFSHIMCAGMLAHELRHAGRHFNDPDVRIDFDGASGLDNLAVQLLHTKLIEADAKAFESAYLFLAASDGGTGAVDWAKLEGMDFFSQLGVLRFEHIRNEAIAGGVTKKEAFRRALADCFDGALCNQQGYEDAMHYHVLVRSEGFPALWAKIVDGLDMGWVGRLTSMDSLGGASYLPDRPEIKAMLVGTLSKTAERFAPAVAERANRGALAI